MKTTLALLLTASLGLGQTPTLLNSDGTGMNNPTFRNAVLPAQTGAAGKYLKTDGTSATWEAVTSGNTNASDLTSGVVAIARGGTGATDAATARTNLGISGGVANYIDVTASPYSAVGDGRRVDDAVVSGTTTLTSASAAFVSGYGAGSKNYIRVEGVGTAPTTTVNYSGGAVTAVTVNVAGTNYGYKPNLSGFATGVRCDVSLPNNGSSGTLAIVYGNTNSVGAITSFTIVNGGSGYTTQPTVTCPPADLITTFTRNSDTSITLAQACPTSGTGKTVFFGTDNTTVIQNALDAALASTVTRTVYFPLGSYICNARPQSYVKLLGANFKHLDGPITTADLAATANSVLLPGVSYQPVVHYRQNKAYGARLENLLVCGSLAQRGIGLLFGEMDEIVFPGVTQSVEECHFSGFEYGIVGTGIVDSTFVRVGFSRCTTAFKGYRINNTGGCDSATFISCTSNYTTLVFDLKAKHANIFGGDFNNTTNFCKLLETRLTVSSMNLEGCTGEAFMLYDPVSFLDVGHIQTLNQGGCLVADYGTSASGNGINIRSANGTGLTYQGSPVAVKTTKLTLPQRLPVGTAVLRYSDITWATPMQLLLPYNFTVTPSFFGGFELQEPWINNPSTANTANLVSSNLGALNWTKTNAAAGGLASSGSATNGMRFSQTGQSTSFVSRLAFTTAINALQGSFETKWRVSISNQTDTVIRFGMFSLDGTVASIPANGIGFRYDKPLGDTGFKLVKIASGVETVIGEVLPAAGIVNGTFYDFVLAKNGTTHYSAFSKSGGSTYTDSIPLSAQIFTPTTGVTVDASPCLLIGGAVNSVYNEAIVKQFFYKTIPN